jgi:hypothetical protein|tara:strand:- start:2436 stop:2678 length:243 start_codon:yes stop_codon:yes gene_type:complete
LARAKKKIKKMRGYCVSSKGLTMEEANAATKAKLIAYDQHWWWLESWQEGEREVERDIKAGRIGEVFDNPEDFLKSLKTS